MQDKIKLYEEMLAQDPSSKLFYHLARLYEQSGDPHKAMHNLQAGLEKHPEHFEARLLLLKLAQENGADSVVQENLDQVVNVLEKHQALWEIWADALEKNANQDQAVTVRLLNQHLKGERVSWAGIIKKGLQELQSGGGSIETEADLSVQSTSEEVLQDEDLVEGTGSGQEENIYPEVDQETPEGEDDEQPGQEQDQASAPGKTYRTKTMADILAGQGEYAEALKIYTELEKKTTSSEKRQELQNSIQKMQNMLAQGEMQTEGSQEPMQEEKSQKKKLLQKLEHLASKLESR